MRFARKQALMLNLAIIKPPIAGPKSLAALKQVEFIEIALPKSFLSSTTRTNADCLKGASIAAIQFKNIPKITMFHILSSPNRESNNIIKA